MLTENVYCLFCGQPLIRVGKTTWVKLENGFSHKSCAEFVASQGADKGSQGEIRLRYANSNNAYGFSSKVLEKVIQQAEEDRSCKCLLCNQKIKFQDSRTVLTEEGVLHIGCYNFREGKNMSYSMRESLLRRYALSKRIDTFYSEELEEALIEWNTNHPRKIIT